MLLLDNQQIHMALPGNVKAVPVGAAVFPLTAVQYFPANGADQFHLASLQGYHTLFFSVRQTPFARIRIMSCGLILPCARFVGFPPVRKAKIALSLLREEWQCNARS